MMIDFDYTSSLEELEKDFWKHDGHFPSSLVQYCYTYRKIPVNDLTIEQLRLLIGQNIGLKYLIPLSYKNLKSNILSEGDLFEGDLLISVIQSDKKYWKSNPIYWQEFIDLINKNTDRLQKIEIRSVQRDIELFKSLK